MREELIFTHLPMIYGDKTNKTIGAGKINGYRYEIKNVGGSHPTAYVMLDKNNVYYDVDYDEIPIVVHGGLTYSSKEIKGQYWIGWDYAHIGDYTFYSSGGKKWTTDEILSHVKDVIKQLIEIDKITNSESFKTNLENYKFGLINLLLAQKGDKDE